MRSGEIGVTQQRKELRLLRSHPPRFLCRDVFVFIAEEMEEAVNDKELHRIHKRDAFRRCVAVSRLDGKDDIPEELWVDVTEFSFTHGEGDDIGRTVPFEVSPVVFADLIVIHKKEAQFALFAAKRPHQPLQAAA